MREHDWSDVGLDVTVPWQCGNTTVTCLDAVDALLVSGDMTRFAEHQGQIRSVGLGQAAPDGPFLLRLARDRALWVEPGNARPPDGWHDGFAISAAGDAYAIIQLLGDSARHLLAQGTSTNLHTPSPSAALLFAGEPAALCRRGDAWWLWVTRSHLPYHWQWLQGADSGDART